MRSWRTVVGVNLAGFELFGVVDAGPVERILAGDADEFDDVGLRAPVGEFGGRSAVIGGSSEDHDTVRFGEVWRTEEDGVDDGKDGGVGTDARCQSDAGGGGETSRARTCGGSGGGLGGTIP